MDRIFHEDIVKIDLANSGNIHRTFMNRTIGKDDDYANRFGAELYFDGVALNLDTSSCIGLFMAPDGQNIIISDVNHAYAGGNRMFVQLPQACYNVEGQFTLALKIIESPVTNTVRIIDGVVCNTGSENPVAPVGSVPTYQEVLAVFDQMLAAKAGAVRYDIVQTLTDAQKTQARDNIGMINISFDQISGDDYMATFSTKCEFSNISGDDYMLVTMSD